MQCAFVCEIHLFAAFCAFCSQMISTLVARLLGNCNATLMFIHDLGPKKKIGVTKSKLCFPKKCGHQYEVPSF